MTKKRSYSSLTTLAVFAAAITPAFAGTVAVVGQQPTDSFMTAASQGGSHVSVGEPASPDADILIIATGSGAKLSQYSKPGSSSETIISSDY